MRGVSAEEQVHFPLLPLKLLQVLASTGKPDFHFEGREQNRAAEKAEGDSACLL